MITVGNVKILMKCVHTFGTGRHKREADITLLFEYIQPKIPNINLLSQQMKEGFVLLAYLGEHLTKV